jgi:hemerythrin-like domain-containing protein
MAKIQPDLPAAGDCKDMPMKAEASVKAAETTPSDDDTNVETNDQKLPKLSAHEFRIYNRLAEHMDYFHNHFRQTWNMLYGACEANKRPSNISIRQFLSSGLQFCSQLQMHHDIEEVHVFPVLARKMPAFQSEMEMKTAHKSIHAGLEKLEPWLEQCRSGERELNLRELKVIMDGFGKVLWSHLDEEVQQLGAENMRKYWTIAEMQKMPM